MARKKRDRSWVQTYFFLFVPNPQEGELLSSWLTRIAIEHRYSLSKFISLFVRHDGSSLTRKDLDSSYDEELFERLHLKSTLSKKEILSMSLRSEEGYLFTCNDCLYLPNQIRKLIDKRTHYGLMYCPQCLSESQIPYFRKIWRYTFYNACPKHKNFLTDRCWRCYSRVDLLKIKHMKDICICYNCEKDLRESETIRISSKQEYGLKAIRWFEAGLKRGYFIINHQRINSVFVFESFTRLSYLLNRKENLKLSGFPLLNDYKALCQKLQKYNSKKALAIEKDFLLTAMGYYLFQNYPKNFIRFAKDNHITHRDFVHGFDCSFWYKSLVDELVPMENKIGREISESEVLGAIKYLRDQGKTVNQLNVAEVVGCHFTIHKGFVKIYKKLVQMNLP